MPLALKGDLESNRNGSRPKAELLKVSSISLFWHHGCMGGLSNEVNFPCKLYSCYHKAPNLIISTIFKKKFIVFFLKTDK